MSLVFYYAPYSSASSVHWALEELGIPYEKVQMDLQAGDTKKPDFLKINPNGMVPTIVHDGVAIFESVAIMIHLGETFGVEKKLYPPPGLERSQAVKWIVWFNVSLGEALSRYVRNTSERIPEDQRNAKAGEEGKSDVLARLGILDQELEGKSYLVGDSFTLADVHGALWMMYLGMCNLDMDSFKNITAWKTRCLERPAAKRAP
jgi:glutathione S-transferase